MSCNENILSLIPPSGKNGLSSYTYVAYADDVTLGTPDVVTAFNASTPLTTSEWFAIITSSTPLTPIEANFQGHWAKFKGADGTGAAGITIKNNGTAVSSNVTTLNFIGAGETGVDAQDAGFGQTDVTVVTAGLIRLLRTEALTLISTNSLIPGATYHLYDVGGLGGVILKAITDNQFANDGHYITKNPDYQNNSGDFQFPWMYFLDTITPIVQGGLYSYDGLMYENLTGVLGTAPNSDITNWSFVPVSDPRYITEIDFVVYDIYADKILKRSDKRGNVVTGTEAINAFKWGDDLFTGNIITNVVVMNFLLNSYGTFRNNIVLTQSFNIIPATPHCLINIQGCIFSSYTSSISIQPNIYEVVLDSYFTSTSCRLDLSVIKNLKSVIITDHFSNLIVEVGGAYMGGGSLDLPEYAKHASTVIINNDGFTIDTILNTSFIDDKSIKFVAYTNTSFTIQPTAKASALAGQILSDDLTALTLTNVNTPITGNPTAIDFCEIFHVGANSIYFDNWNIVNSKIYV